MLCVCAALVCAHKKKNVVKEYSSESKNNGSIVLKGNTFHCFAREESFSYTIFECFSQKYCAIPATDFSENKLHKNEKSQQLPTQRKENNRRKL